jgi:hypothetical protein
MTQNSFFGSTHRSEKFFFVPIRFLFFRRNLFKVGFSLFFIWSQCVNRDITALGLLMFSRLIIADVGLGYLLLFRANFADKQYNTAGATRPTGRSGTAGKQQESEADEGQRRSFH